MRLALIQVADDGYQFIWSHHHILLDGWSLQLLFKEALAFYAPFRDEGRGMRDEGGEATLSSLIPHPSSLERRRPYRDYIAWQQQQDLSEAETFWRQALKGFTAPTPLGGSRMPESVPAQEGGCEKQEIRLSAAMTAALQSVAQQHRLTLNTLVQGAWSLLLSRYSGEADVLFGALVSGRPTALVGIESMVGLIINTLPVRVLVSPG